MFLIAFRKLAIISILAQLLGSKISLATPYLDYQIIGSYPHNISHFTQGLELSNGIIYESTGGYGKSKLLAYSLTDSRVKMQHKLSRRHFGEGLTILDNHIFQLTWKSGKVYRYQQQNFKPAGRLAIEGEGWGLTSNGEHLIYSNGSANLYFISPVDGQLLKTLHITESDDSVQEINELEWVDGLIYANIWHSDDIVIINPDSGQLVGRIDLSGLLPKALRRWDTGVLNGIAYDSTTKQLIVTGKNWPVLYEIQLDPTGDSIRPPAAKN